MSRFDVFNEENSRSSTRHSELGVMYFESSVVVLYSLDLDTSHTLIRCPWGRQKYFKPKRRNLILVSRAPFSFGGLRGLWSGCVSMDAPFHRGSNDTIGGRVRLRRPEISPFCPLNLLLSLALWRSFSKFIVGVVDTGDKHSFAKISANFRKNSKRPQ